ncbi:MAG: hypothetical protein COB93_05095 [Sneathiella sp.]|nr:MAG: hypothetical protein COB93_05095 [Sneathiella sp.]
MTNNATSLLGTALLMNAVFSGVTGLACLLFADTIVPWTGIASWILYALGVGLLIFAADVAFTATRAPINLVFAKLIIVSDAAWVVGSILLLIFFSGLLTFNGQLIVELIAIIVAVFATVQSVGVSRLTRSGAQTA